MEVKENLYERIDILCSADIITKDDAAVCGQIVDILAQEREDVDEEKAGIFITHLAMALKRTKEGEKEEPIDAEILEALKEEPVYEKASAFFGKVMGRLQMRKKGSYSSMSVMYWVAEMHRKGKGGRNIEDRNRRDAEK